MKNEKLIEARKGKGYTQHQMAAMLAMEQTTYSKKENGVSPIRNDEWTRIAMVLGIAVEDIRDTLKGESVLYNVNRKNYILIAKKTLEFLMKQNAKLEKENNTLKVQLNR